MTTVTGPFEVRKNLTLGAGVKLYRDQTITPETKAVFDFASDWAGGNKDLCLLCGQNGRRTN